MKCENCPACRSCGYEDPETYCAAGVPEHGKMVTKSGCKYSLWMIRKRVERRERMQDQQYDGIGDFYATEQELDTAMKEAILSVPNERPYSGDLVIGEKQRDGTIREISPEDWSDTPNPLQFYLREAYEKNEEKVQKRWCNKCIFQNRHQICTTCSRNRKPGRDRFKDASYRKEWEEDDAV